MTRKHGEFLFYTRIMRINHVCFRLSCVQNVPCFRADIYRFRGRGWSLHVLLKVRHVRPFARVVPSNRKQFIGDFVVRKIHNKMQLRSNFNSYKRTCSQKFILFFNSAVNFYMAPYKKAIFYN